MIEPRELKQIESQLCTLMNERLGLSQTSLAKMVARAGRRLPAKQRLHAQTLIEALAKVEHPQLYAQISEANIHTAEARLTEYLKGIDRKKLRIDRLIKITSGLAFNLLVLTAVVIVLLRLRGYI